MNRHSNTNLGEVSNHPLRLYSVKEMAKILRITPNAFRMLYQKQVPPIKAGTSKGSRAYWTDEDVIKCIDLRFPGLDVKRREFMIDQLLKGNRWKE